MKGDNNDLPPPPDPCQKCARELLCFVFLGLQKQEEESADSVWKTEHRLGHALSWTDLHSQRGLDPKNKQTQ